MDHDERNDLPGDPVGVAQHEGGAPDDSGLAVWLLGHQALRHKPDVVRVALRIFFRGEADALHAALLAGDAVRAPHRRGDPSQLARTLRGQGFLVALRRDEPAVDPA